MFTNLSRCAGFRIVLALCGGMMFAAGCAVTKQDCCKPEDNPAGVHFAKGSNSVRITINGDFFTEYFFKDVPRPYFYPVLGPEEQAMTRNWPMKSPEGEEHDHPHHRSLWYGHGSVNGIDFWAETNGVGKIVHEGFTELTPGKNVGVMKSHDEWDGPDGTVVCTDDRTFKVYNRPGERLFDFEVTIHASKGPVTFNDTKEGTMAMRLAETMRLKGKVGQGHIVNSEGVRDGETWGKRADWVDYYGPVNGKVVGVAMLDHPQNPRHPTTWHVRDYGLFAANPFGLHDMEKKPAGSGDLMIPAGESVTFKYRFYIHEGDVEQGRVGAKYREYVEGK